MAIGKNKVTVTALAGAPTAKSFLPLSNEELNVCLGDFENIGVMRPIDFFVKPH